MLALLSGLPAVGISFYFLWTGDFSPKIQWTLTVVILGFWGGLTSALRLRVIFPLQTISSMLASLREGDYSIRIRPGRRDDSVGGVALEVNVLGETLKRQRMEMVDATNLLRAVIAEIDVAVFAFDQNQELRLANRAGERLMAQPAERILTRSAVELGLADCLEGESTRTLKHTFPGGIGRWGMRRSSFREGGLPHTLIVMTDLSQALRDEERQAWQRLVRVLGHELNNSLTPIKSMAGSLSNLLKLDPLPDDWQEDVGKGLSVINTRSETLVRFISSYSRLARLPQPDLKPIPVAPLVERIIRLETRLAVSLDPGPEIVIPADGAQLEQLLINLVRNAVDAAQETSGRVEVGWEVGPGHIDILVWDEGPGISETSNLFVPFFTTKKGGSGIGLVLCRQIAEAHRGSLTLENRSPRGCKACLRLPLDHRPPKERDAGRHLGRPS